MIKLFELRRQLADKQAEGRALVEKAITENRDCTPEEHAKVKEIRSAIEDIQRKIVVFELRDSFDAQTAEERSANGGRLGPELPDLDGKHAYSVVRALNMILQVRESKGKFSGLEYEVHQELEKFADRAADGIRIPLNLRSDTFAKAVRERRDVTTSTAAGGIANILGTELIDILRNRMVIRAMGGRVLQGLTGGTFSLPKQTAASTAYHVAEGVAPTTSNPVLNQVTWTPRTLGAIVNTSRKALLQTSVDIEAITRGDMMRVMAIEMDRVAINGSGGSFQPLGIMQDPNIPITAIGTNGGAPTWDMVVGLESTVAAANADFGAQGYIASAKGRGKMKRTLKVSGSNFPIYLWEKGDVQGEGEVNSYRALHTNQIPDNLTKGTLTTASALIFGVFESATYGLWSGLDVLVDPYSGSSTGAVKITMFQDYDLQFRYENAFAKCVDMDIS
jgi:HK97 family phage major capsid protein